MTTKLRLTLDVEYDLNGEEAYFLKNNLESLVFRAVGEGLLTAYSEAEVDHWSYKVEEVSK
jgi:hypothetical protein